MGKGNLKVTPQGASQDGIVTALQEIETLINEMKIDSGVRSNYLAYIQDRDGVVGGNHTLGVGTGDTTKVRMSGTVRYRIDGVEYSATDVEGDFPGTADVTANGNGAWRIMIGKTGALTMLRATADGTTVAMNYATAEIALLSIAQLARTAGTVDIGYLMIHATNGQNGFTPQTDVPATSDTNVDVATYYNVRTPMLDNGFTAAPSVGLSEGTNDDEYAYGTINVRTNGLNVAQIVADTTIAFAQNDVVTTSGKYGGHLFVTDVAGTAILSLAATGIAGSAQTVDYNTLDLVTAALDAVQLALPHIFTVIGRETNLTAKATFTYNTDDLVGTDGQATWTDEVATAYDRTVVSGALVGPAPPTIPAATAAAAIDLDG